MAVTSVLNEIQLIETIFGTDVPQNLWKDALDTILHTNNTQHTTKYRVEIIINSYIYIYAV